MLKCLKGFLAKGADFGLGVIDKEEDESEYHKDKDT
jgi:hypothetical protein